MDYCFLFLSSKNIPEIIPLIQRFTNHKFTDDILSERYQNMFTENYECVGIYQGKELIGLTGLWYQTRHYAGKSCEVDHVFIEEKHRNNGLGKKLFSFIEAHVNRKGCEALELNTYVDNALSHKFYYNRGFSIIGFHFVKNIGKK